MQEERLGAMDNQPTLAPAPPVTEGQTASWGLATAAEACVWDEIYLTLSIKKMCIAWA